MKRLMTINEANRIAELDLIIREIAKANIA
jgi:hypothetical protein